MAAPVGWHGLPTPLHALSVQMPHPPPPVGWVVALLLWPFHHVCRSLYFDSHAVELSLYAPRIL